MHELLAQISVYVWGVWRFRWLALICAWLLSIAGWLFVWQMPEAYVGTARVYVDSNTVLGPLLKGLAIQPNINQRISLMSRTLLSRPNLEKLLRMSDLDLQINDDLEKEEALEELSDKISLRGDPNNASLYSIAYENEDRESAKRIVQALITVFIESSLGDKREDSSGASEFLDEQIADYEKRLIEAEERLADFKQRYVGTLPGETGGYYERLEAAKVQLSEAQLHLEEMKKRRDELKRQLEGEDPAFVFGSNSTSYESPSALDARIQDLDSQLDHLRTRYTDKHPEVVQIKLLRAQLEAELKEELAAISKGEHVDSFEGLQQSPFFQEMRSMISQSEATIAERKARVDEYEQRVKSLEEKVNNIPLIETELKQLTRDYGVIQQQHNSLLGRRESALISQRVEQNANDVTFRVVDPPFVPITPSEPNKLILNTAVMFAAIGAGIGISLLLSLLRPVIVDHRTLSELTGLPYLGAVTIIQPRAAKRRHFLGLLAFSSVSFGLVVLFTGVLLSPQLVAML